jgi:hypothetical protein
MATLDDIPILPPTTPTTDDLIAVIDGADRRSPKQVTLAQVGALVGGTPTAASIVSAMESATEEQKQALLPETIEVDYIETTDQSGFTIPDGAFGQKGGVPYFGNEPIRSAREERFINAFITDTTSGGTRWNRSLGDFPVPANLLNNGLANFLLEADLVIQYNAGIAPTPGTLGVVFGLAHQHELDSLAANKAVALSADVGPLVSGRTTVQVRLRWLLTGNGNGLLAGGLAETLKSDLSSATSASTTRPMLLDEEYGVGWNTDHPTPGIAESLHVVIYPTGALMYPCQVKGQVNFTISPTPIAR